MSYKKVESGNLASLDVNNTGWQSAQIDFKDGTDFQFEFKINSHTANDVTFEYRDPSTGDETEYSTTPLPDILRGIILYVLKVLNNFLEGDDEDIPD